jgi:hypothetical protein
LTELSDVGDIMASKKKTPFEKWKSKAQSYSHDIDEIFAEDIASRENDDQLFEDSLEAE